MLHTLDFPFWHAMHAAFTCTRLGFAGGCCSISGGSLTEELAAADSAGGFGANGLASLRLSLPDIFNNTLAML